MVLYVWSQGVTSTKLFVQFSTKLYRHTLMLDERVRQKECPIDYSRSPHCLESDRDQFPLHCNLQ